MGVDEEADQALGFQAWTVGVRYADADVALTAVAMQQALQCREQQHERGRLLSLCRVTDRIAEARAQTHGVTCGAVSLFGGSWVIGGQLQRWMLVAQLRFPPGQLPRALALR
ncbi:hypothetical protein D3C72_787000 [compost metagenome]